MAGRARPLRTAEVLKASVDEGQTAFRIGGDEFAILMPGVDGPAAEEGLERIRALVVLNNKYYREPELSIALGAATSAAALPLEKVISLADAAMYQNKGEHYRRRAGDPQDTNPSACDFMRKGSFLMNDIWTSR